MRPLSGISEGDLAELPSIESELARASLRLRFVSSQLEARYQREQREGARLHNRCATALLIALFDAFIIPEVISIPDIVPLSAVLRFAVLTPLAGAFLLLDWRGIGRRWSRSALTGLLIAPTLVACIESFWVRSPLALANFQAVPLIQLVVLTCRMSMMQALLVNVASCALFITLVFAASFVPAAVAPSMVLTDLAICISTLVFAWRIDQRDRQVFLFTAQATIGRALLAAQNRTLAALTRIDALTGLGNRRCFDETLAAVWAEAEGAAQPVSLVLFDIDCFKQFNDVLGHQAGDECLGALARTVARCVRDEHDTLVRYGGEEFAIILPRTSLEEGAALAERVRQAVLARALPHPGGSAHHLVTVSLGVATVVAPAQTTASLIEAADQLLYEAKRGGRNCVVSGPKGGSLVGQGGTERLSGGVF